MSIHLLGLMPALLLLAPDDKTKKDEDAIQGSWSVVNFVGTGKELDEDVRKQLTIAFKEGAMEVLVNGKSDETYGFKLDSSKKPRHIDILEKKDGKEAAPALLGIYEIDGDTLKICWNKEDPRRGRPAELRSTAENKFHLMTLKRKAK
jgi:uncharacterized protein (TIGR03067 family)